MQSRLFWITVMYEALLTQELDLPTSNILDYEDRVPLPRFVNFPGFSFASMLSRPGSQAESADLSFCHYHFLSQIAHRRILTRLRNSMFSSRYSRNNRLEQHALRASSGLFITSASDYPPQALEDELFHQIERGVSSCLKHCSLRMVTQSSVRPRRRTIS
jgi:hypothetical protein